MFEVRNFTVSHGLVAAVRDVSFVVPEGGVLGILGPNGAGKTSLLEGIAGRAKSSGEIFFGDYEGFGRLSTVDRARRGLRLVPQGRELFHQLTVGENLKLGIPRQLRGKRGDLVAASFEQFPQLADRRNTQSAFLSGGEKQMLALARALIGQPSLLLLDEPSFGLAPKTRHDIVRRVVDECKQRGLTLILAEQFIDVTIATADRLLLLAGGGVAWQGAAEEISVEEIESVYLRGERPAHQE